MPTLRPDTLYRCDLKPDLPVILLDDSRRKLAEAAGIESTHYHMDPERHGDIACGGTTRKLVCSKYPRIDALPFPEEMSDALAEQAEQRSATHLHPPERAIGPCAEPLVPMQRWAEKTCPERGPVDCTDGMGQPIRTVVGTCIGLDRTACTGGECHIDGMGILPDPYRVHRCPGHEGNSHLLKRMAALLRRVRPLVGAYRSTPSSAPRVKSAALRDLDLLLAEFDEEDSPGLLPVAVFYGDLDDETPEDVFQQARGNGDRRVLVVGLKPEAVEAITDGEPDLLTAVEKALKVAGNLPLSDEPSRVTQAQAAALQATADLLAGNAEAYSPSAGNEAWGGLSALLLDLGLPASDLPSPQE